MKLGDLCNRKMAKVPYDRTCQTFEINNEDGKQIKQQKKIKESLKVTFRAFSITLIKKN